MSVLSRLHSQGSLEDLDGGLAVVGLVVGAVQDVIRDEGGRHGHSRQENALVGSVQGGLVGEPDHLVLPEHSPLPQLAGHALFLHRE